MAHNRAPILQIGAMSDLGRKRHSASNCDVRFTPESGHSQRRLGCPLSANSGHPTYWTLDAGDTHVAKRTKQAYAVR